MWYLPPMRRSDSAVILKPCGPNHSAKCSAFVYASKTSSRGASIVRVMMTSFGAVVIVKSDFVAIGFKCVTVRFLNIQKKIKRPGNGLRIPTLVGRNQRGKFSAITHMKKNPILDNRAKLSPAFLVSSFVRPHAAFRDFAIVGIVIRQNFVIGV